MTAKQQIQQALQIAPTLQLMLGTVQPQMLFRRPLFASWYNLNKFTKTTSCK